MTPFYQSLVAGFFVLFLLTGVFYGVAARTIHSHRDVVRMTSQAMADMGPYIVLAFVAAHFVAMFNWSGLGAGVRSIFNTGAVNYRVNGDVTVGTPVGNFTIPYSQTGRYSTLGR